MFCNSSSCSCSNKLCPLIVIAILLVISYVFVAVSDVPVEKFPPAVTTTTYVKPETESMVSEIISQVCII